MPTCSGSSSFFDTLVNGSTLAIARSADPSHGIDISYQHLPNHRLEVSLATPPRTARAKVNRNKTAYVKPRAFWCKGPRYRDVDALQSFGEI